jgi:GT2 family glycosyltransferase
VFVILTSPADVTYPGATVLRDDGPVNIQRWWNRGIAAAGADHVALFNDDVTAGKGLIPAMSAQLDATGAAICFTGTDSPAACMTGWAFMIDTRQIRPDERFAWYFGDNDLRAQALNAGGITHVTTRVHHHHPGESTARDQSLQALAEEDRRTYAGKWPD